jgi:hypothetical protein
METVNAAGIDMSKVRRAKFSALTKGEVEQAFDNLVEPDIRLAEAAEARQIVDLAWGAVLTRLISLASDQVGKNFLSVGRVQSPTLKLLVDRHEEIENFVPVPYWNINGRFGMLAFRGSHTKGQIWDREEADSIYNKVKDAKTGTVSSYEKGLKEEYRPPPFDTTAMQAELEQIDAINSKVRTNLDKAKAIDVAREAKELAKILDKKVEDVRFRRDALLQSVKMPLPGLTVEQGALVYNGQRWDCMSSMEQFRVSVAVCRQLKPDCGFVLLDKLEAFDLEQLKEFNMWLVTMGMQAIATRVSQGDECSIIIEDGMSQSPFGCEEELADQLKEDKDDEIGGF